MGTRVGTRERFEQLFSAHYDAVLRYAQRRVDPGDAADVAAEVFLVAWRRLEDVPPHALPWLYAVARRVCANQRRGAQRRVRLAERVAVSGSAPTVGPPDGAGSALAAAFERLPEADREVLALIAWEGLGARDASTVLGCSLPAVTMRLHRARRRLRALLEESRRDDTQEDDTQEEG